MARKVILDCDPGIADAVAMTIALFEPRLEVMAITAVEGVVPAERAGRNIQTIIDQLDPPRLPRVGAATSPDDIPSVSPPRLYGNDGLGNLQLPVSELHHQHASERVICEIVRSFPEEVTIVTLGPLTNIARALKRDVELASLVGQLIILGGSVSGSGDVTAAAEFNMAYDPCSAREVLRSATTKTLIPLEITRQVSISLDMLDELPDVSTPIGKLLRTMLQFAFRAYRQTLGLELIDLPSAVAIMALLHPELFETEPMACDVEVAGELTAGATVFDRRRTPQWRSNMDVATAVDSIAVTDAILRGLTQAGGGSK